MADPTDIRPSATPNKAVRKPKLEAADLQSGGVQEKPGRRKIPGGLPYTTSPGVLRRVLERMPISEKPTVFNPDFLATVMGASGGAARPIIPILKTSGFLTQTGSPTELYAQFQTDGGRGASSLQALKNGFGEIFKRNQYAHKATESALIDIIVAITGLPKGDSIIRYIVSTFQVFQAYAKDSQLTETESQAYKQTQSPEIGGQNADAGHRPVGLVYNINIVLPETTNVEVYNSIFKSLKGNLL